MGVITEALSEAEDDARQSAQSERERRRTGYPTDPFLNNFRTNEQIQADASDVASAVNVASGLKTLLGL